MIVAERQPRVMPGFSNVSLSDIPTHTSRELDWDMADGRLTESSDGKVYRLREAIAEVKRLGRTLTDDEMKRFEVSADQ